MAAAAAAAAAAEGARYGSLEWWRATCGAAPADTAAGQACAEWYADFTDLKPLLARHCAYGDNLLVVGPGLSRLHEQLYDSGFRGVTVVDAAEEVLARWRARSAAEGRAIKFERADVTRGLDYARYSYNAIIDKGTLDCLLCRDGGEADARAALRNLHAALRAPGTLLLVSHSPPGDRLPLLRCVEWESIQAKAVVTASLADVAAGCAAAAVVQDCDAAGAPLDSGCRCYVYICRKPY